MCTVLLHQVSTQLQLNIYIYIIYILSYIIYHIISYSMSHSKVTFMICLRSGHKNYELQWSVSYWPHTAGYIQISRNSDVLNSTKYEVNYKLYHYTQFQNSKCVLSHSEAEFALPVCWYYSRQKNSANVSGTLGASRWWKSSVSSRDGKNTINFVYLPFHAVWWLHVPPDLQCSRQSVYVFVWFKKTDYIPKEQQPTGLPNGDVICLLWSRNFSSYLKFRLQRFRKIMKGRQNERR
jgi:hypothetical protein